MEKEDSAEETKSTLAAADDSCAPKVQQEHLEKDIFPDNASLSSSPAEIKEGSALDVQKEDRGMGNVEENTVDSPVTGSQEEKALEIAKDSQPNGDAIDENVVYSPPAVKDKEEISDLEKDDKEKKVLSVNKKNQSHEKLQPETLENKGENKEELAEDVRPLNITKEMSEVENVKEVQNLKEAQNVEEVHDSNVNGDENVVPPSESHVSHGSTKDILNEEDEEEPVFDGTEVPDSDPARSVWPEKAAAITNFVRVKSAVAVSSVLRRLSGRSDDGQNTNNEEDKNNNSFDEEVADATEELREVSRQTGEGSGWTCRSLIKSSPDLEADNKTILRDEAAEELLEPVVMKGRILLYSRLRCQECKEARLFLHSKRLRYVEINIDVYQSRKLELEKIAGSSVVPKVFFNEVLIGGLSELKSLDESGNLKEKLEFVINEQPSFEAPLPPLFGEDDASCSGAVDESAVIVQKMKRSIIVKDRFYKMRRFASCFGGSEAVDFLSKDQQLARDEAIELGRKLADKLFFNHVLDENLFEDGNHFYRFLDDDPVVSECQNIPRGISEVMRKPIADISSRIRFLSYAIFEAYTSPDGLHVDYRSIHGSEEFARYLRIIEELQRVDLRDMSREDKLAFFINLYNMMAIHAILVLGHPNGTLERRRLFGEFKYVIGGLTYSLSAIYNGILRGNQRPPYNLIKSFGVKDKRLKLALPYPEPLVHFALVNGHRSSPPLRCYSPVDIDKDLMEAACNFLQGGGLIVDFNVKVAFASSILKWYSVDFGRNEVEVLKHAANYLEPSESQALLELLANSQLKVVYNTYDWRLNH